MPSNELVALSIFSILLIISVCGMAYMIKIMNKDKKNKQRVNMVLELMEKHPDMSKEDILDLVDETIK
jgi:hypothetical protein